MVMQKGEHCGREVVVTAGAGKEGRNPSCSCGFAMRKRYSAPIFAAIPEPDRANHIQELISLRIGRFASRDWAALSSLRP
jgi:hypothetical protein